LPNKDFYQDIPVFSMNEPGKEALLEAPSQKG